jgi:DNA-binding Lrp family transcriptional regulator
MALDDIDYRLLAILRDNARTPVTSLAHALGVSRGTVQNRIDKLVQNGVIRGFTVRLKPEAGPHAIRAMTLIQVAGQKADSVIRDLRGYPEVRALYTTNGKWDIVAEIETGHLEQFDQVLRRIRMIGGIAGTETSILLSSYKG